MASFVRFVAAVAGCSVASSGEDSAHSSICSVIGFRGITELNSHDSSHSNALILPWPTQSTAQATFVTLLQRTHDCAPVPTATAAPAAPSPSVIASSKIIAMG